MRRIDINERRARLGQRHGLAQPFSDAVEAARSMAVLHSSDPATVFISVWARVPGFQVADLEEELYSSRSLVRIHGMRRTLWVATRESLPWVFASTTRTLGVRERKRTARILEDGGVTNDGTSWLDRVLPEVLDEVARRGEVLTRQLTRDLPELQTKITFFNKAGRVMGSTSVGSRVLLQLSMESRIVRARPAGSWISGQYRWAETTTWLGGPIPDIGEDEASRDLVSAWLRGFGPGTESDLQWWTGWPLRQVRRALDDLGAVPVELDSGIGHVHPDDVEPVGDRGPWVAVLPSLDPTTMGWKERDWYLGDHGSFLFDSNGNAGPTVWVDGRIVGGWGQRVTGEIVYRLLEPVSDAARLAIEERIGRLNDWIGTTVTPRFGSPLGRELSG